MLIGHSDSSFCLWKLAYKYTALRLVLSDVANMSTMQQWSLYSVMNTLFAILMFTARNPTYLDYDCIVYTTIVYYTTLTGK